MALSTHEACQMIDAILAHANSGEDEDEVGFDVRAFRDMRARFDRFAPSEKQAVWIRNVYEKIVEAPQYENLVSTGKVPLGRPVETPLVLRNLPKKPPGRRP